MSYFSIIHLDYWHIKCSQYLSIPIMLQPFLAARDTFTEKSPGNAEIYHQVDFLIVLPVGRFWKLHIREIRIFIYIATVNLY